MNLHQVGQKQAAKMYIGGWWKDKTAKEIVDFQLFVLDLCVPYDKFHTAMEQVLERQIDGEEFGTNYDGLVAEYLNGQPFPTKDQILSMIPMELRV